ETRTGFLAARGLEVRKIKFATAFGRGFDYYTGFVFELHKPGGSNPLIAGGRYDALLARLGAREAIPAVGFAVSVEELAAAGGAPWTPRPSLASRRKARCRRTLQPSLLPPRLISSS